MPKTFILKFLNRLFPMVFFAVLVLLILGPFLQNGYIFSYDGLYFYPKIVYKLSYLLPNQTIFLFFLEKLSAIIPTWIIQRMIWFSAFYIGALGFFYLFRKSHLLSAYLAGTFFIFNPFVYERMVMGQTFIILGFAFYPWVILLLQRYFQTDKKINLLIASLMAGISIMLFPHSIFILFLCLAVFLVYQIVCHKNHKKSLLTLLFMVMMVMLININWIFPSFHSSTNLGKLSTQLSSDDFTFYATSSGKINNIWFNVLTLNGFWAEREHFFTYQLDSPLSQISMILLSVFIIAGIYLGINNRNQRLASILALSLGIVAVILAIGKAHPLTNPPNSLLYQYLPFYKALREPQKWVAILVLVYSFFLFIAFSYLLKKLKNKIFQGGLFLGLLIILILNTHQLLGGFRGQLKVSNFPQSWYEINQYLNQQPDNTKVLFLPWRFYIELSFAGRKIINPALSFFDRFTYIGSDLVADNTYYQLYSQKLKILDNEIQLIKKGGCPDLTTLKKQSIGYILLAKEDEWQNYQALFACPGIKMLENKPEIDLFAIEN